MNAQILQALDRYGYLQWAGGDSAKALAEYQLRYSDQLSGLTVHYHGRRSVADGVEGPASYDLLVNTPRCGCPDFATTEEASFPESCRNRITTSYQMTLSGFTDTQLRDLWANHIGKGWSSVIDVQFVFVDEFPRTNIFATRKNLGGGTLAWQTLSMGGCGDRLEGAVDNRTWADGLFLGTMSHEWGHALGLGHHSGGLMNPYIMDHAIQSRGMPIEVDIAAALRLGYRRRTNPPPDNPDPPSGNPKLFLASPLPAGTYELKKWVG